MPTESVPAAGHPAPAGRVPWARRAAVPVRDPRFWIIQVLVLAIDVAHTLLEDQELLVGDSELYLLSVSVFLIPVVYAGLSFGLRGAIPTTLLALILSIPEISHHDATVRSGIIIQFAVVMAIAVIVGLRVDREQAAAQALEQANRQLSRLNATASAVAGSLDLDQVLHDTLRAELDPRRQQVAWIRLTGDDTLPVRTTIEAVGIDVPGELAAVQEDLTSEACRTGELQRETAPDGGARSVVAPLKSEGRTVGAIGLSQASAAISPDEFQVHTAVANQLSVALDNIGNHQRSAEALLSLKAAKENLEIYVKLATEAQEEERKRLSRELHDDILQSLVVAKGQIESAGSVDEADLARHRLTSAQHVLEDAIVDLRRYCRALRPSLLDDLGLVDAVDWLVGDLRSRTGLSVEFESVGTAHRLSSRDELLIFRIVQEALHNVERHAHATEVHVLLTYSDGSLTARVRDNGCGMEDGERRGASDQAGLGLRGMDERTKLLAGRLTVLSRVGLGTDLTIDVPLVRNGASRVEAGR
jgi:signal transduction histidine kinase